MSANPYLRLAALALLLGGCAGSGGGPTAGSLWDRTKSTVATAYQTTKTTVSKAIGQVAKEQREGWKAQQGRLEPPPKRTRASGDRPPPPGSTGAADRFPERSARAREENVGQRDLRPVTRREVRGSGPRELVLIPRKSFTPEEIRKRIAETDRRLRRERDPARRRRLSRERAQLARALKKAREEENLIREMASLRARLRRLQKRLLEVQQQRP